MRVNHGRPRRATVVVPAVLAAFACARATDEPIGWAEVAPVGGAGGSAGAMAGSMGMGVGGGSGGTGGAGAGGSAKGGAGAGGAATGGAGSGGDENGEGGSGDDGAGGAGKGGTGTGGAGAPMGGAGNAGGRAGGGGASAGKGGTAGQGGASGKGGTGGQGGAGGQGGGGGQGGASGKGGSAGKGGAGGKGGSAGTAGSMGGGGAGPTESGCARLSVPLNAASDKAHFAISLTSTANLSAAGTTISVHLYVQAGSGGVVFPYAQDPSYNFLGPATRPLLADQDGWVTLRWNVAAEPNGTPALDKTSVKRIGIEVNAAPSSTWSNPTVVFVDSISVNTPSLSLPFGTSGTVSTSTNQTSDPSSQVLWLNADSSDTTASGTALSWVATCP